MVGQAYDWTCSVCASTWVLQSTGIIDKNKDPYDARYEVGQTMGYPNCVNETYGCMSSECVVDVLETYGLLATQAWVTYDQAYAICRDHTGVINPVGMYHYMAIRGIDSADIWVANSARGYRGIYDNLDRSSFNALGPVQIIYVESYL